MFISATAGCADEEDDDDDDDDEEDEEDEEEVGGSTPERPGSWSVQECNGTKRRQDNVL
jgi:hypothetical protein